MKFREIVKGMYNTEIFKKLNQYVNMIEEKNKVMNLTGFKEDQLWEQGIFESLVSMETAFEKNIKGKMLDIGAGAGFPSIPLVITNPNIQLKIHEPLMKRVNFLKEVANALKLNVRVLHVKTQNSVVDNNYYDFITARAVTNLKELISISLSKGNNNSQFGFIKGPKIKDEIIEAKQLLKEKKLNVFIKKVDTKNDKQTFIAFFTK